MTGIRGDDGEASLEACVGKRSRVAAYRRRRRAVIAFAALIQESTVPRSEWPSEVRPQVARAADNVGTNGVVDNTHRKRRGAFRRPIMEKKSFTQRMDWLHTWFWSGPRCGDVRWLEDQSRDDFPDLRTHAEPSPRGSR
jgi:hypothetical protein